jgi:hypothetical protein
MIVPGFLLRQLYVKGSLQATPAGFSFKVANKLGSGAAHAMAPVTLDGKPQPMEQTFFKGDGDGKRVAFAAVSDRQPFTLAMGHSLTISVESGSISRGKHKIGMAFVVKGIGELSFDVTDEVA